MQNKRVPKAKKGLGQNFLIDEEIVAKIVSGSDAKDSDTVLEIGPGRGALTEKIAAVAGRVIAVELDPDIIPALKARLIAQNVQNVEIKNADILAFDISSIAGEGNGNDVGKIKVIGNLPYYITTPIIMKLLETEDVIEDITCMVQKEVADRMQALPGGKERGALSVAVQYRCHIEKIADVPAECFDPQPKVDSCVLRLVPYREKPICPQDEKLFAACVRAAFSKKRKTLANSLVGWQGLNKQEICEILAAARIDPERRAESLTAGEFCRIADVGVDKTK